MSKTKFNGFEKYFIQTALRHAIQEAESDVLATESEGKKIFICTRCILLW